MASSALNDTGKWGMEASGRGSLLPDREGGEVGFCSTTSRIVWGQRVREPQCTGHTRNDPS